jgi:predicted MPP superfamily phosphohydrolase
VTRLVVIVTAILGAAYAYLASRLAAGAGAAAALAVPFFLIWIVPVYYWGSDRDRYGWPHMAVHQASYLSMAWLSFVLVLALARDALLVAGFDIGVGSVVAGSVACVALGAVVALRGPRVERVDVPIAGLHPDLEGYRIVQISDLHVGLTIRRAYVERVVEEALELEPDLVALTGDMVDGPVSRLAPHVEPLGRLPNAFFILGNHDCYSGASAWIEHFRSLGARVLLNEHTTVTKGAAKLLIGGVVDPAYGRMRPEVPEVRNEPADLRLFLAHNPKLARMGARAGFDLQLSGHTHAGQFFPWTLAVRLVHSPHVAGLTREDKMWVYVSAGTGTWGPPVRFGTSPEITLVRLVRA